MQIRFARSAGRHGVHPERARYVIVHCLHPIYPPPDDVRLGDRIAFLGPDQHGVPLEVVALEFANADLLVIHVMRLRSTYLAEFLRVVEWQEHT